MKRRPPRRVPRRGPEFIVLTGLSGSGKSHVLRALEDLGWFCVDNLPTALIPRFVELAASTEELRRSAVVADVREPDFLSRFPAAYRQVKERGGVRATLVFLEADDKVLLRRFSETRRPHPMAENAPVADAVRDERDALRPLRKMADRILDTTGFTVHQLRDYVRERDQYGSFMERLEALLEVVVPGYVAEGKSYLTVAIGCTGGRHRSVVVSEELGKYFAARGIPVTVAHRDLGRD